MNYKMIGKSLGSLLCVEAACMVPSLVVALIYAEGDAQSFAICIALLAAVGFGLGRIKPATTSIYARDGFIIVALGWLLASAFGALPFLLSGTVPTYVDAFFEAASGFSTTGSSILRDVEAAPHGILFWRSFTHWIGGMGVLVLMLAVLLSAKANTLHIMKAESPGPTPGKVVPKIGQTAKILYVIYLGLTVIQVLFLLAGDMPLYDSLVHTFGTAGTGGFSIKTESIGYYKSAYIDVVITVFMALFGVNFSLYYILLKGNLKSFLRDDELRFYFGVIFTAITLITINVYGEKIYSTIAESLRHSAFQVSSIITTTGYATTDFTLWPVFSQMMLLILMFIGASAGSTGGGIKCVRIFLLFKIAKRRITRLVHPKAVQAITMNGHPVEEETLSGVMTFFFLFLVIFVTALLAVAWEGKDMVTTASAVMTAINNVGPGLGQVGPLGNFADFSWFSKTVLSLAMIIGRLELYPILLLVIPASWKKVNI